MSSSAIDSLIENISKDTLVNFCREKSGDFKKSDRSQLTKQTETLFPELYQQKFASLDIVGYFPDIELMVILIKLKEHLTLSERSCRRMQYDYAKFLLNKADGSHIDFFTKWLGEDAPLEIDKGLFVFYDDDGNFRFSLVEGLDSKGETQKRYRRYTFFVDKTQTNRTFKERMDKSWTSFEELKDAFSVERLNKEFYNRLFAWYEWACNDKRVEYPNDTAGDSDKPHDINQHMIRLITRLIFVWFLKQMKLVPEELFDEDFLKGILKDFDPVSKEQHNYYRAILQNLFFATLNKEINERSFAHSTGDNKEQSNDHGIKDKFRYQDEFTKGEKEVIELFDPIPFLNGGLFECLDHWDKKKKSEVYVDGFSQKEYHQTRGTLTWAHIPNEFFFSHEPWQKSDVPKNTENVVGTEKGLIPLLKQYNFTVDENANDDESQEVALDPELLGKVFENLLASYNPETKETARKSTGSFYTPREIVNYMVDESLKAYLIEKCGSEHESAINSLFDKEAVRQELDSLFAEQAQRALTKIEVLDPACGSGAFPMGMLHRLLDLRKKLHRGAEEANLYQLKLNIIENCIYGVDIQCIAVQISKLRFFISLVCEQTPTNDPTTNYGINPLPNLETKFVAADSLSGLPEIKAELPGFDTANIGQLKTELWDIRHKHFQAQTYQEKKNLRQQDQKKRDEIKEAITAAIAPNWERLDKLKKQREKFAEQDLKVQENSASKDSYLFSDMVPEVKESPRVLYDANESARKQIDAEIAMEIKKQSTPATLIDAITKKLTDWNPYDQNTCSPYFDPKWMFNVKDGFDIVIGNPPYVEAKKLKDVVAPIKQYYDCYSGTADLSVYFYEKGLSLCKENGILTYICTNKFFNTGYGRRLRAFILRHSLMQVLNFEQCEVFENVLVSSAITLIKNSVNSTNNTLKYKCWYKLQRQEFILSFSQGVNQIGNYPLAFLSEEAWSFSDETDLKIKNKIEQGNTMLSEIDGISIYRGITTGYNPAFIITDKQRDELIDADRNNADIIKNMLQGRNIRKWYYQEKGENLIFTRQGINIKNYPIILTHLQNFKKELTPRKKNETTQEGKSGRKPGSYKWYEIQDITAYYPEFEKEEKIIWGLTADKWAFAYDDQQHYLPSNSYILTSNTLPIKYILGLLNSKVLEYYFSFIGVMTAGGAYTLKHDTISRLPFPPTQPAQQQQIIALVDDILAAKKTTPSTDTSALEKEIDQLVYQLYGLSDPEIAVIEASLKKDGKEKSEQHSSTAAPKQSVTPLRDDDADDDDYRN